MDSDEVTYLHELLKAHTDRVRNLEVKKAKLGINCPPEVEIEINGIDTKISAIKEGLGKQYNPALSVTANRRIPAFLSVFLLGLAIGTIVTWFVVSQITSNIPTSSNPPKISVTDLEVTSGKNYRVSTLENGVHPYIDRTYVYVKLPRKFEDKSYIITANDDKMSRDDFHIKFKIDRNAIVYIAYNDCYSDKPSWLSQFRDTGESMVLTDAENTLATYSLYAREFSAGSVLLGGNISQGEFQECGMYSIIISDN